MHVRKELTNKRTGGEKSVPELLIREKYISAKEIETKSIMMIRCIITGLATSNATPIWVAVVINLRMENRLAHVGQTTYPTRLNAIFRKR